MFRIRSSVYATAFRTKESIHFLTDAGHFSPNVQTLSGAHSEPVQAVLGTVFPEVRLPVLGALLPLSDMSSWHTRGLHVYSVTDILLVKCNFFFSDTQGSSVSLVPIRGQLINSIYSILFSLGYMWGVQVLRYPNFFLG